MSDEPRFPSHPKAPSEPEMAAAMPVSAPAETPKPEPRATAPATTPGVKPSASPPAKPADTRVLIGVTSGIGGAVLGLLVGISMGKSAPAAPEGAAASAAVAPPSSGSSAAAGRPAAAMGNGVTEIAIDMGAKDQRVTFTGPWSDVQLGARTAGRLGFTASLGVVLSPLSDAYGLAVVARVDEDKLDVGVRVNGQVAGRWLVSSDWDMYALVLQPGTLAAGANTIEFTLPKSKDDKAVAMVIDTLHLGPLQMRAHADLGGANPRGSLIDGYYGREGEGEHAQSWSAGKHTRVGLLLKPLNADYEIELQGAAFGPLQPLTVEARVNGTSAGTVKVDKDAKYTYRVQAGTLVTGFNTVDLVYAKTIKPSQTDPKSKDQRELGIRIGSVTARPVATQ